MTDVLKEVIDSFDINEEFGMLIEYMEYFSPLEYQAILQVAEDASDKLALAFGSRFKNAIRVLAYILLLEAKIFDRAKPGQIESAMKRLQEALSEP